MAGCGGVRSHVIVWAGLRVRPIERQIDLIVIAHVKYYFLEMQQCNNRFTTNCGEGKGTGRQQKCSSSTVFSLSFSITWHKKKLFVVY